MAVHSLLRIFLVALLFVRFGSAALFGASGSLGSIVDLKQFDTNHPGMVKSVVGHTNAPSWYMDAVFYHVWLDGFADSDGDGFGDLTGLLNHMDYLNDGKSDSKSSLGVNAIWLSPFFSANSRHRYDATSFYTVDPKVGNFDSLKQVIQKAHERGMHVIFDMVPNHTSSRHPYFVDSLSSTNSALRDFYVWTNSTSAGPGWRRAESGSYYSKFSPGMPDWNYENPLALQEMENVMRFYFNLGFDGVRLDAVRYLIEEGSKSTDTDGSHRILKDFRKIVGEYPGADLYMVGEAWAANPIMSTYYGKGDEMINCFNFSFGSSIADAIGQTNGSAIDQNISYFRQNLPGGYVPANFLVNHDDAGARSVTRYNKDMLKVRLAVALNLLEWGVPYVYYGEEIGMEGAKGSDRNMRRPFLWNSVPEQINDPQSLFSWHRSLIRARLGSAALRHGDYKRVETEDPQVYAFLRSVTGETALCLFNLNTLEEKQVSLDVGKVFVKGYRVILGTVAATQGSSVKVTLKPGEAVVLGSLTR
jgi:alpha-amylase